jgi:UDP:flavonoid glycosyltransferase YjiC (YdhE family)
MDFRPASNKGFVEDLRTANGVIAGGGFSLLSEAVFLAKPVLSVPLQGQFEQLMNARYLERCGYGLCATEVTPAVVDGFLSRRHEFAEALAGYEQAGNSIPVATVEAHARAAVEAAPGELRRERRRTRRKVR